MTDMDEIGRMLNEYGLSMYEEGRYRGRDEGSARKHSALLQRVEALREERDEAEERASRAHRDRADALNVRSRKGLLSSEWLLRTGKAERERDAATARAETAESALAALQAAPPDAMREAMREIARVCAMTRAPSAVHRIAAIADRALAPAPPDALREAAKLAWAFCHEAQQRATVDDDFRARAEVSFSALDRIFTPTRCAPAPPAALRPDTAPFPTSTDPEEILP